MPFEKRNRTILDSVERIGGLVLAGLVELLLLVEELEGVQS